MMLAMSLPTLFPEEPVEGYETTIRRNQYYQHIRTPEVTEVAVKENLG